MLARTILLSTIALFFVPTLQADEAQETKKRRARRTVQGQILKSLSDVGLTEEQTAKVKEMGKEATAAIRKVNEEAGITAEVRKKRAEATKSLKDSDKKGKARQAAINEAAGLTEKQVAGLAKANELRQKFQISVVGLLTAEQKEKLPMALKRLANAKKGKRKKTT